MHLLGSCKMEASGEIGWRVHRHSVLFLQIPMTLQLFPNKKLSLIKNQQRWIYMWPEPRYSGIWRAFCSPLIYPQSTCLRLAKRQRWRAGRDHGPLTRVEFRPLPAPGRLCSPLLFSVDSPALLPGGTPAPLPLHCPAVSSFIHSPPPYTLPYFLSPPTRG